VYEVEGDFVQLDGEVVFTVLGAILGVITGTVAIDVIGASIALNPSGAIWVKGDSISQHQFYSFGKPFTWMLCLKDFGSLVDPVGPIGQGRGWGIV
jgi:hypothetical protein